MTRRDPFLNFVFLFFQVVQGEVEVVIMTVGIGILGVILVVTGTGITVVGLTTDQTKLLAQIHRTEATGAATTVTTAAATATAEAATTVTDSPTLTKPRPSEVRTSRPSSSLSPRLLHRLLPAIPRSPSPRHRLRSSTLHHRWCPTPCHLSSLSKHTVHLKEVIYYCFFVLF